MVSKPSLRLCFLALAVLAMLAPNAGAVSVLDARDSLPHPVHAYGMARVDDTAYLVGGGQGRDYVENITAVRPDGSSSIVAELPQPTKSPAAAAHDGTVYVFGGAHRSTESDLPQTTSDILRFDPSTGTVETLLDAKLPEPVSSASAVEVGGSIYVLGGLKIQPSQNPQVDYITSVVEFDPDTGQVTELDAKLPTGRAQASAVAVGGDILYLGGHAEGGPGTCASGQATCFVDDVLRFRPDQGQVGEIGQLASGLRWTAAAVHEGTVYVMGGCRSNCGPHQGDAAIQTVDPSTGATSQLPVTMPLTGGRNDAILHDDVAWLPGGVRATDEGSRDHVRVLRVKLGATAPWAPLNLSSTPAEDGIELTWDPPSYDGGEALTGYVVERARGAREPTRLDRVPGTTYHDLNASQGETYTYRVRAANTQGVSAPSGEITVRPTETPGPPRPTANGGDGKLVAQWSPPEDTGGLNLTSYRVYAYPANATPTLDGCGSDCWGEVSNTTHRVTIRETGSGPVENGNTYTVRVQARNPNGWGDLSPPANATPKPVPDPPNGLTADKRIEEETRSVELTWTPPDDDTVTRYTVYRGPALDELTELGTTEASPFTDEGPLPGGQAIVYVVSARNGGAEGPLSQPVSVVFAEPPGPVADLNARWTGEAVQVAWSTPNETGGRPIQHYEVARTRGAMDPEEANATIHRTATTSFRDPSPPRGTPTTYHVRAVTGAGEGGWTFRQLTVPITQDSRPPVPALAAHPTKIEAGQRVVFDASGSSDDGGIVAYNFAFGDGEGTGWRSSPRVTHTYESDGVFNATVSVRDTSGLEAQAEATIAVGPPPDSDPTGPTDPTDNATVDGDENGSPLGLAATLAAALAAALVARRRP